MRSPNKRAYSRHFSPCGLNPLAGLFGLAELDLRWIRETFVPRSDPPLTVSGLALSLF